jgi:hypothetical protein
MADLSYVGETAGGCRIYRETSGRYVVNHAKNPRQRAHAATLASAYALCRLLEMGLKSSPATALQQA